METRTMRHVLIAGVGAPPGAIAITLEENPEMVLDRSDVRSSLASYGASPRSTATEFVPCGYVRFYDTPPQESTDAARTWYARGQNFVLAYSEVISGVEWSRTAQPDEYRGFV